MDPGGGGHVLVVVLVLDLFVFAFIKAYQRKNYFLIFLFNFLLTTVPTPLAPPFLRMFWTVQLENAVNCYITCTGNTFLLFTTTLTNFLLSLWRIGLWINSLHFIPSLTTWLASYNNMRSSSFIPPPSLSLFCLIRFKEFSRLQLCHVPAYNRRYSHSDKMAFSGEEYERILNVTVVISVSL